MFFDKFLTIYFLGGERRGIATQGKSAMVRDSQDDGKCADLRGKRLFLVKTPKSLDTHRLC